MEDTRLLTYKKKKKKKKKQKTWTVVKNSTGRIKSWGRNSLFTGLTSWPDENSIQ
jgi:hypothetical protein